MATPDQIQEQVQLERDAISQGINKLKENTDKLQAKEYASASVYGVASLDVLIPLLVERIKSTNNRIYAKGIANRCSIQGDSRISI